MRTAKSIPARWECQGQRFKPLLGSLRGPGIRYVVTMMAHSLCVAIRARLRASRRGRVDTIQRVRTAAPAVSELLGEMIAAEQLKGQGDGALAAP